MSLMGVPGLGCPCNKSGLAGFFGLGETVAATGSSTDASGNQVVLYADGSTATIDALTGAIIGRTGPLAASGAVGSSGWFPDHQAADGVWVDTSDHANDGSYHAGAFTTSVAPPTSSTPSVAQQALSVPGQITGAVGMTPAQALTFGLTMGGVLKPQAAPAPAPMSSGIGLGTGLLIGGALLAGAWALSGRSKTASSMVTV